MAFLGGRGLREISGVILQKYLIEQFVSGVKSLELVCKEGPGLHESSEYVAHRVNDPS